MYEEKVKKEQYKKNSDLICCGKLQASCDFDVRRHDKLFYFKL